MPPPNLKSLLFDLTIAVDPSRRNLLFGRRPQTPMAPRPPWASPAFLSLCTRCGDCASACPSQIIKVGDGGFPKVDFTDGECTFCGDCASVCQSKALDAQIDPPWQIHAQIDASCLAQRGVDCRICGEACDQQAIRFQLAVGKVAQPMINTEQCTGCGACVAPCPSNSIRLLELIA
ncbi:ferredoxin-type protein NapF [Iodobacter sp.]|uniref:ferredoxin-type protein NapF n=1 Tax=Iodobacter sp. TaxID=1915058 RepID=UPI0025E54874|nr:ferredoxin-type protein NapF [Iodobacter sp.]